jgi:hypothetical protein
MNVCRDILYSQANTLTVVLYTVLYGEYSYLNTVVGKDIVTLLLSYETSFLL